jgi:hypothetical protein
MQAPAIEHEDHINYLEDGYLKHVSGKHVEDRMVEVTAKNPDRSAPEDRASGPTKTHRRGPGCTHEAVRHGDHIDYLVDGACTIRMAIMAR